MKPISSIRRQSGMLLACLSLAFAQSLHASAFLGTCSPNGSHFVAVADQGRIDYRNTSDNSLQATFYICHPIAISFSPDGKLLAAAGIRNGSPAKVKVWRVHDHQLLCEIMTGGEAFKVISLSSDGVAIAGVTAEGRIEVWRVSDGRSLWFRNISSPVESIQFSTDSRRLLVQTEKKGTCSFDSGNGRPSPDLAH